MPHRFSHGPNTQTHKARTLAQFLPLCHPHKHTDEEWDITYREIQIRYK